MVWWLIRSSFSRHNVPEIVPDTTAVTAIAGPRHMRSSAAAPQTSIALLLRLADAVAPALRGLIPVALEFLQIELRYAWRTHYANSSATHPAAIHQSSELRRVKSELRRATEGLVILKTPRRQAILTKYAFMLDHQQEFRLRSMCRVFGGYPSGYNARRSASMSPRGKDAARVLGLINQ